MNSAKQIIGLFFIVALGVCLVWLLSVPPPGVGVLILWRFWAVNDLVLAVLLCEMKTIAPSGKD